MTMKRTLIFGLFLWLSLYRECTATQTQDVYNSTSPVPVPMPLSLIDDSIMSPPTYSVLEQSLSPSPVNSGSFSTFTSKSVIAVMSIVSLLFMQKF
jgi:hypothetical protein